MCVSYYHFLRVLGFICRMDYKDEIYLDDLAVCWTDFSITLKVDTCFARVVVEASADGSIFRRHDSAYDVVFYDKKVLYFPLMCTLIKIISLDCLVIFLSSLFC